MITHQTIPDAEFYLQILRELSEHGVELARRVGRHPIGQSPLADPAAAVDDIARAVRRNEALARHIAADPANTRPVPRRVRGEARAALIDSIAAAVQRRRGKAGLDLLHEDIAERLADAELEIDFDDQPIEDLITEIAADLDSPGLDGPALPRPTPPKPTSPKPVPPQAPSRPPLQLIRGGKYGEPRD